MAEFYNMYSGGICWSKDPLIVMSISDEVGRSLLKSGKLAYFLKVLNCGYSLNNFKKLIDEYANTNVVLYICCNTLKQENMLRKNGFERTIYFNRNALIDENTIKMEKIDKKFDLACIAQMHSSKNLDVINNIDKYSVYVMTYCGGRPEMDLQEYLNLKFNDRITYNRKWLNSEQVNFILNQSTIGLNLSTGAGGMCRALAEYALCGLPIVTTYGEWFDGEFLNTNHCGIIHNDEPKSKEFIREVNICINIIVDNLVYFKKEDIRFSMISMLKRHRCNLIKTIMSIGGDDITLNNFFMPYRQYLIN